ncbi:MAG: GGDEF domain-containing protein [Acidimicrobiales bacterium]
MSRGWLGTRGPLCIGAGAVVLGCYLLAATVAAVVPGLHGAAATAITGTLVASLAGIAVWLAAPRLRAQRGAGPTASAVMAASLELSPPSSPHLADPPLNGHRIASAAMSEAYPETERLAHRLRFDQQLERAVSDAEEPNGLAEVITRALSMVPPEAPAEWLQLGARRRKLIQVAEVGPDGEGPGCPVSDPGSCEAIRRDRTLRFSGHEIDACRHLLDREQDPRAAVCIPVRVQGEPQGVLHRTATAGRTPGDLEVSYLESMAAKLGSRLAVMRLQSLDMPDGTIDHLTGLLSAAGLEVKIRQMARSLTPFALAQCDIDHFAAYSARFGPAAADEAMGTLARAALRCLRPDDLLGRGGHDELLAVFPATTASAARSALERLREELLLELTMHNQAPFTVSFGVIESTFGQSLDELLVQADAATALAKHLGRNRVVLHDEVSNSDTD